MKSLIALSLTATGLLGWIGSSSDTAQRAGAEEAFSKSVLALELNATDLDAEVILALESEVWIDRLTVRDPSGREVFHVRARDGQALGLSEILLESGEPSVLEVLEGFPEGSYQITAHTTSGDVIHSTAALSHQVPAAPAIIQPLDGQTNVPAEGAVISWAVDASISHYIVEIELDSLGASLEVQLPASTSRFEVPSGFLVSGEEVSMGIAAVGTGGNRTVSEIRFVTE
jgi:hypothetical protein